ncbi:hypothetical protein ACFWHQ_28755 [Streptomyces sp. NPDC060334]|uniref:hypothetical protein n=1 Tax=unclassified Streptomyces TaxID=2593676 RepID=UPI00225818A2|nr:hypothetical protein [Streptomyces sp. NBC_00424]MCX5071482.1 hypothetical protein [Streptomyces sp. NBC_00424]WUD45114.1 hypothetical protein OHA84_33925 [Streptomyces sp. NBC_00513]
MRIKYVLASAALSGAALVALSPGIAQADVPSSRCQVNHPATQAFCFHYNSNQSGAIAGWDTSYFEGFQRLDDAGVFIQGTGAGETRPVKNNAASATFQKPNNCYGRVEVYFNSNWSGAYDTIWACTGANLVKTKNNNASFRRFN